MLQQRPHRDDARRLDGRAVDRLMSDVQSHVMQTQDDPLAFEAAQKNATFTGAIARQQRRELAARN